MTSSESHRAIAKLEIGPAFGYGWKVVMSDVRPWILIALALLVGSAITSGLSDASSGTPFAIFFIVAGFVLESVLGFLGAVMAISAVKGDLHAQERLPRRHVAAIDVSTGVPGTPST